MNKNIVPDNFTMSMVIVDSFPVIFFSGTAILVGVLLKNPVFIIGAIISALSGILKVLWKLIVVKKKKNVWPLFIQMRIAMPIGFVLMIAGVIISRRTIHLLDVFKYVTGFPLVIFFGIGLASMVAMMVLAITLDSSKAKNNWIEQLVNGIGQFSIFIGVLASLYFLDYYHACNSLDVYKETYNYSQIEDNNDYIYLKGIDSDKLIIFYQGAKVEPMAYIPSLVSLNQEGVDVVIIKSPYNFANFNSNGADEIIDIYGDKYEEIYIAGHSFGGFVASSYASKNAGKIDGLIMEGAYSTDDLTNSGLKVLSMQGENDKVLHKNIADKCDANLPADYMKVIINGGNHSQFGDYGFQAKDGEATITKEEQWEEIKNNIKIFVTK